MLSEIYFLAKIKFVFRYSYMRYRISNVLKNRSNTNRTTRFCGFEYKWLFTLILMDLILFILFYVPCVIKISITS